jgi:hypothetical protein
MALVDATSESWTSSDHARTESISASCLATSSVTVAESWGCFRFRAVSRNNARQASGGGADACIRIGRREGGECQPANECDAERARRAPRGRVEPRWAHRTLLVPSARVAENFSCCAVIYILSLYAQAKRLSAASGSRSLVADRQFNEPRATGGGAFFFAVFHGTQCHSDQLSSPAAARRAYTSAACPRARSGGLCPAYDARMVRTHEAEEKMAKGR